MIIYTQYVINAYCFIMCYNTEVQISAIFALIKIIYYLYLLPRKCSYFYNNFDFFVSLVTFDQFNTPLLNKTNHFVCILAFTQLQCFGGPENAKLLKTTRHCFCVNYKKSKFVKTVISCVFILCIQSICMCGSMFIYKVTSPSAGLACIMQRF